MADAVHAEQAFFSTWGSSLSVKAAMMSVAGLGEKLLVSRNVHTSVMAGLIRRPDPRRDGQPVPAGCAGAGPERAN